MLARHGCPWTGTEAAETAEAERIEAGGPVTFRAGILARPGWAHIPGVTWASELRLDENDYLRVEES